MANVTSPNNEGPPHDPLEGARNISFVGNTDQGGQGDGVQVMVNRGYAYISSRVSRGVMVTDIRDPRNPRPVNFAPIHPDSLCMHLRTANDLLLCIEELDLKALLSIKECHSASNQADSSRYGKRGEDFSAGMRVYGIADPANPGPIGFMAVEGLGLHRIRRTGGRYAYGRLGLPCLLPAATGARRHSARCGGARPDQGRYAS